MRGSKVAPVKSLELKSALVALGMPIAFDPERVDLTLLRRGESQITSRSSHQTQHAQVIDFVEGSVPWT